jgi:hypothetical protein
MDEFTPHRIYALFTTILMASIGYILIMPNINDIMLQIIVFSGVFLSIIFGTPDDEPVWILYSPAIFLAVLDILVLALLFARNRRLFLSVL